MHAQHATAPVLTKATSDAPIDPWLRMRLAPVRARRPVGGGATVVAALRAIASARPDPAMLTSELRPVRALLERERGGLRQRLRDGAPMAEIARAEARLLDGTVIGLCHLARLLEPWPTGMAPLAVIARGDYGRRKLVPGANANLLFLVASEPGRLEQGLAIARLVARELAGLGWQASVAKRTVRGCLAEMHLDRAIAADLAAARLVWGCHGLFAELRAALAQAMPHGLPRPAWRPTERSARQALAA
jgi:UTP:GlnB (protein PII) uridylyltransferase